MDVLFGKERADALRPKLKELSPPERELIIIEELCQSIKSYGSRYTLPFTFITAQMSWDSVDLDPVLSLTLSMSEENVLRFEILAEDEWQAKLNHMLEMA